MQPLSVYIDESRNCSSHAERPAFGVIAGLVIPQDAINVLNREIEDSLNPLQRLEEHESKWRNYRRITDPDAQDPSFERAQAILDCVFNRAAYDRRMQICVSALNGKAYNDEAIAGQLERKRSGSKYKQLMDWHYRFFVYSVSRALSNNSPVPAHIQFSFDQLTIGEQAISRLHEACSKASRSIGARARNIEGNKQTPSINLDFQDSAQSPLVQFSDLLAGATCAGLDDNVNCTRTRMMLLQQMATGIADMHGKKTPTIQSTQDWQKFVADYIDRPDTRFVIQRPYLLMDSTAKKNAQRYWSYVKNQQPSAA